MVLLGNGHGRTSCCRDGHQYRRGAQVAGLGASFHNEAPRSFVWPLSWQTASFRLHTHIFHLNSPPGAHRQMLCWSVRDQWHKVLLLGYPTTCPTEGGAWGGREKGKWAQSLHITSPWLWLQSSMTAFSASGDTEEPCWEIAWCMDVLIDVTVRRNPLHQLSAWSLLNLNLFNDLELQLTSEGLRCCLEPPQQSCLSAGKQMHLYLPARLQSWMHMGSALL